MSQSPKKYDQRRFVIDGKVIHRVQVDIPVWGQQMAVELVQAKEGFAQCISTAGQIVVRAICAENAGQDSDGHDVPSILDYVNDVKQPSGVRKIILENWDATQKPVLYHEGELIRGTSLVHLVDSFNELRYNSTAMAYVRITTIPTYCESPGKNVCTVLCAKVAGKQMDGKPVPTIETYLMTESQKSPFGWTQFDRTSNYDYKKQIVTHQQNLLLNRSGDGSR